MKAKPFMRYVAARFNEKQRDIAYRIFVTESLKLIPQKKYLTVSYENTIRKRIKETNKSGDEIAIEVMRKNGLKFR